MKPESSWDPDISEILKAMESQKAEYPPELLAKRRAAFLEQLDRQTQVEAEEVFSRQDQKVIQQLATLKSVEAQYPVSMLAARRSAFKHQVAQFRHADFWHRLRLAVRSRLATIREISRFSYANVMQTSLVLAAFLFALAGFLMYGNRGQVSTLSPSPNEISKVDTSVATATPEVKKIACQPGDVPPLCMVQELDPSKDLTYQGNGSARPAVAKDTLSRYGEIHRAAYLNDGRYGPEASWVSSSKHSWIKIDLGKATIVNTVTFGRDRLGQLNDGDPGRFTIAVALRDDVYADGDSSNDNTEYTQVFDSTRAGFDGNISGAETVMAQFDTLVVRFIKITFENAGTAVDEVEVFLLRDPAVSDPTRAADDEPAWTPTSIPTSTPLPTSTPIPTLTETPLPTDTSTPVPTDTPIPTDTPMPVPTDTLSPTDTPIPIFADTPIPTDIVDVTTLIRDLAP